MYKFMGVRHYDFVPKDSKDGKPRKGYNFWFIDEEEVGDSFAGIIPFKYSVPIEQGDKIFASFGGEGANLHVMEEFSGMVCDLSLNRYGKLQGIRFAE